ncbi:PLP-dependent aminotransferase family protein [Ruficoccus amylovorans]|uniref:PLP-dependent aminotransferase family protein n=1 Tax=Ruficoccus amylovorans TaxID=1804625 RepID=A0A842HAB3_9BACT|nr:PLP-dependent aminotransferase family protein [Ruficoccus amylovorans]MBC2593352.1 PLP-dependent aminotransferase family protein [Ruficoccus amylovorans]
MSVGPASGEFLYERIARQLDAQIQDGVFRVGERLPSVRQLCASERVSPASALQALSLLEARGLIEARPKSGFFVRHRRVDCAPPPPPSSCKLEPGAVGVSDVVAQVFYQAGDERMVPLGAAIPAPELLPTERLSRCLAQLARSQPERLGRYDIKPGHPELLRQLVRRFASYGCHVAQEELVVTFGAMEALNLAVRAVTHPGDIVAVESPCYFGLLEILESLGLRALPVPGTCEEGIDLDLLETAIERHRVKAVMLVPSFSNPNGSCMSQPRRERLMALLADHGIPLVEDDIYGDIHFGPERPRPVKSLDRDGLVLYCGSFSKILSPGLRVGWVAGGRYSEQVRRLKYISSLTTPAINQLAIARFLESTAMERHLRSLRQAFRTQMAQISEEILASFPEGTGLSQPEGGFYLWVQLPDGVDAFDLHRLAAAEKIDIAPGQIFCPHADIRNRIRISCGYPCDARIRKSIHTLARLVRELAAGHLKPSKR